MTKRKSISRNEFSRGMAYQRGIDVAVKYFKEGLPLLLDDQEVGDLETCLDCLKQSNLADKTYFGNSEVLIADYISKLKRVYSKPETIKHGLRTLEEMGKNIWGSDLNESPYIEQIEKINYKSKLKR
jgi:hypothetical protein